MGKKVLVKPVSDQPFKEASFRLSKYLNSSYEDCTPLTEVEINELAPQGDFLEGWKFTVTVEKMDMSFALLLDVAYPFSSPKIVLLESDHLFLAIPHLELGGSLCILTDQDVIRVDDNVGVAKEIIDYAITIVSDGVSKRNYEEFYSEFNSYWCRHCDQRTTGAHLVVSIVDLNNRKSRSIVFLSYKGLQLLAETYDEGLEWIQHRFEKTDKRDVRKDVQVSFSAFIWLDSPIAPEQYPLTNKNIWDWGENNEAIRENLIHITPVKKAFAPRILFAFETENGPAVGGVMLPEPKIYRGPKKKVGKKSRGGRPSIQQVEQFYSHFSNVVPFRVQRVENEWLLYRGGRGIEKGFDEISVGVVGCGSLGGYVADYLCRAGVGKLLLLDPDYYSWDNAGRHILPGYYAGQQKAVALRSYLEKSFPQANIQAVPKKWENLIADPELAKELNGLDLIISTTGEHASNLYINGLFLTEQYFPPAIYAWAEAYCVAGHAVLVASSESCLCCGYDDVLERYKYKVAEWEAGQEVKAPACGESFMPYGSMDMVPIATMTARLALDFLSGRVEKAEVRTWLTPFEGILNNGGALSEYWKPLANKEYREVRSGWVGKIGCKVCKN